MIVSKVWNLVDGVPSPFDMDWGRRLEFPQYVYLHHFNRRIAKARISTHMDDDLGISFLNLIISPILTN